MLYLGRMSYELLGRYHGDTPSYITQIYLVWGTYGGKTRGKKGVKTCPSLDKSQYKCYIWDVGHISCWKDMTVTLFHISSKFTLFGGRMGVKRGKNVPISHKSQYVIFGA